MPRFLVPIWSPNPDRTRAALTAASIEVAGPRERAGRISANRLAARELMAVVEAHSALVAAARVRAAVGDGAAIASARAAEDGAAGRPPADDEILPG